MITSPQPVRTTTGELHPQTLAVIHTAGNDFMQRMGGDLLQVLPGKAEASTIHKVMDALYAAGVRYFVVSDVPFSPCVPGVRMATPLIKSFIVAGKMEHLGLEPHDSAELAVELQASALHDQFEEMLTEFKHHHSDAMVVHFDEACALSRLRQDIGENEFDRVFFDMTLIHPTAYGHKLLAQEAHKSLQCVS
jgi:phospholipase/lecithinase/hemolysin